MTSKINGSELFRILVDLETIDLLALNSVKARIKIQKVVKHHISNASKNQTGMKQTHIVQIKKEAYHHSVIRQKN